MRGEGKGKKGEIEKKSNIELKGDWNRRLRRKEGEEGLKTHDNDLA